MTAALDLLLRLQDQASGGLGRVSGAINQVDSAAHKAGGGFGVLQTATGFVIGGAVTAGFNAIKGSVTGLIGGMISGNAQFETYNQQFGVLLGSAEAAKERMADLAEFGATTPFELPQVVEADKILQGFGLHAEEAAQKFGYSGEQIRTIAGDVASGTGASFQEMTLLLGKFSAGATGEAISRMQEMGITTREELANMGLEFSNSGQLLSPLPEAMTVVLGIMEDKYGGMMAAQSTTFAGMVSNLEDWKGATIRRLGEPIFEVVREKLGDVLAFISSPAVMNAIDRFAAMLASGIGTAVDFITGTVAPAVENIISLISEFVGEFMRGMDFSGSPLLALGEALDNFIPEETMNRVWDFIMVVQSAWDQLTAFLVPLLQTAAQFVTWKDILIVLGGFILSMIIPAIAGLIGTILSIAAPIVAAIAIVALLRTAWEQNWGGIQEKVQTVIDWIVPLVTGAIQFIKDWWAANGDDVLAKAQEIWESVKSAVETAITIASAVITAVVTGIRAFWAENGDAILAKAQEVWTAVSTAVDTAITTVQTVVTTVATALQTFWDAHGELILATAQRIWTTIQEYISGVWDTLTALFAAFKAAFEGDWEGFGENLRIAWETAWETVTNYLSNLWSIVAPILAEFVFAAIDYLGGIDWGEVGRNIVQGIANGVTAAAGAIVDAVQSAAQAALDAAKAFLGIESPSRVFEQQVGRNMAAGAARGVLAGRSEVATAVTRIFNPAIIPPRPALAGVGASAGGGVTYVFDFRHAVIRSEAELERLVDKAMRRKGIQADVLRRTR